MSDKSQVVLVEDECEECDPEDLGLILEAVRAQMGSVAQTLAARGENGPAVVLAWVADKKVRVLAGRELPLDALAGVKDAVMGVVFPGEAAYDGWYAIWSVRLEVVGGVAGLMA